MTDKKIIDNEYWKKKYADIHIRLTNQIAELQEQLSAKEKQIENLNKLIEQQNKDNINLTSKLGERILKNGELYNKLKRKEQENKDLREDIKDIANLLDLDIGEEYNFGNIELAIKDLKQECERWKSNFNGKVSAIAELLQQLDQLKEKNKWYDHYKESALRNKELYNDLSTKYDQLKAENEEFKQRLHQCWNVENSFVEQLDKLEAEVKLLRQYKGSKQASYETMQREWNEAKNEVKKLKAENIEIRKKFGIETLINEETGEKTHRSLEVLKLREALQEIKEVAKELLQTKIPFCTIHEKIMEIINEVEDEI